MEPFNLRVMGSLCLTNTFCLLNVKKKHLPKPCVWGTDPPFVSGPLAGLCENGLLSVHQAGVGLHAGSHSVRSPILAGGVGRARLRPSAQPRDQSHFMVVSLVGTQGGWQEQLSRKHFSFLTSGVFFHIEGVLLA